MKVPIPIKKQFWFLLIPFFCGFVFYAFLGINAFRRGETQNQKNRTKRKDRKYVLFWNIFSLVTFGVVYLSGNIVLLGIAILDLTQGNPKQGLIIWLCVLEIVGLAAAVSFLLIQNVEMDIGWNGLRKSKKAIEK